jgi:cytochrome P450
LLILSVGSYYCIGKNLAYMEMQYVMSSIVSKYDIRFAPGETGKGVVEDMVDQFTAAPGELSVVLEQRKN